MAKSFNDYFSSISQKIAAKINPTHKKFDQYLNITQQNSFFISPTSKDDIISQIKILSNNKANGRSSIETALLKSCKDALGVLMLF